MLILENVKKIDNLISAEYYHYGVSGQKGYAVFDVNNKEIVEIEYSEADKESLMDSGAPRYGFGHLIDAFLTMISYDKYPSTYKYSWYWWNNRANMQDQDAVLW